MLEVLKRITDLDYLKTTSKNCAIYPNNMLEAPTFPATDEATINIFIGDDTRKTKFQRSVLRVETKESCADLRIAAWLNSQRLEP